MIKSFADKATAAIFSGLQVRKLPHTIQGIARRKLKLIDATTNRDFSVLLILFALFQVLDWFLWCAAVGSLAFWIIAAGLQFQEDRGRSA